MRPHVSALTGLSMATVIAFVMGLPAVAAGQDRSQGGQVVSGDGGASRGGDSGSGGVVSRGGDSGGGGAVSRGSGEAGSGPTASSPRTASGPTRSSAPGSAARPREDRAGVGKAVPRPPDSPAPGSGSTVVITGTSYYGGYYPWGYGGLGLGGYYGWYDPWWYDPYSYGQGRYYSSAYEGGLRLRVRPSNAEVFVDGYFAGVVDEFDNVFQRLRIESGPHRIEIREDGYEPLTFEVRILPDRTITYRGELKRIQ
jgi:hypothetical protein